MHDPLIHELNTPALDIEHVRVPGRVRFRGHGHEHPHLCIVLEGAFEERGPTTALATAGIMRASPAGDEHDISFGRDCARCLLILLKDPLLRGAAPPQERSFMRTDAVTPIAERIARSLHEPTVLIELDVLELSARAAASPSARDSTPPPWLLRVRDALHAGMNETPSTTTLAAEAGLHPVYVARTFRRWFGCSLSGYARRVRLEQARLRVIGSDEPLARVAAVCGFADQSHLTRALRDTVGLTPAQLRRQVARIQDRARPAS